MKTMIAYEIAARCSREIGKVGNWHECGRPAVVFSDRSLASGGTYRLFYCKRHEHHASRSESPSVHVDAVGPVRPLSTRERVCRT